MRFIFRNRFSIIPLRGYRWLSKRRVYVSVGYYSLYKINRANERPRRIYSNKIVRVLYRIYALKDVKLMYASNYENKRGFIESSTVHVRSYFRLPRIPRYKISEFIRNGNNRSGTDVTR